MSETPLGTQALSAEALEKMRQIGLRLDRAGTFWHQGAPVEHPRLHQALLRWLDVVDGRDVVRLDERRYAYVEIEDAHLRARSARWDGERCWVLWDDGRERELEYAGLTQAADHALYVPVGALVGRIASPAYQAIVERVEATEGEAEGAADGEAVGEKAASPGFELVAAGRRWAIGTRPE